jgi:hypothetical protein
MTKKRGERASRRSAGQALTAVSPARRGEESDGRAASAGDAGKASRRGGGRRDKTRARPGNDDVALVDRYAGARFEFRAWRVDPGVAGRLEPVEGFRAEKEVTDLYLVSAVRSVNVKIRDGAVKVKRLIDSRDGFERWCPTWKANTPLDERTVIRLWGELGLPAPDSIDEPVTEEGLVAMADEDPDLDVVGVVKRRRHGTLEDVSVELTDVIFGDQATTSVTLEGTDLERLQTVRAAAGLDAFDNLPVHVALTEAWDEAFGHHGARTNGCCASGVGRPHGDEPHD